ncbi:MAG: tRNA (adenosine(37)-N6)-threonylcarbamoyltransferase complex ATPase subunit type 1 TsaE [Acidobacteria bacterium]|nr:tRNA (adenosine(37)-N6)-threonylcarbamoyltransferase complex ATPase subunit type 1 TsaE [Acidobacteriota bacterium]NIM64089.1 tRNA (adenosine(37)-N6)-threonylcarbamoyltransferase complex ATPase subunit type 1 TsaE [Acidobacteriota bacterium]NIO58232.1 tRNA (adenosine(37)-N6)-threonylcarbamoyltransferase complex ATPase subunit type 1 TsaE [Acidobacteriota bacterium]NIQ86454.1 tRNA (adenosine(37)-N6)-threonylcarbamoyltransferase complex ATPase subunit type 1 TsaE [Acidobacteriota bacterium]NIT
MPQREKTVSKVPAANGGTVYSLSEQETFEFGRRLAETLEGGELIVLEGDLGMGKTVFARGVAAGLGVPADEVSSPSFTLVNEYEGGRCPLFHVDLYRLTGGDDLEGLGLDELIDAGGVVLVEWGERLPLWYRRDALTVRFHDLGEGSRQIELDKRGTPEKRRGDA